MKLKDFGFMSQNKPAKRPKTGGRQKGTAGVRIFLTVPPNIAESLPKNPKEWRAVVITTLAETYTLTSPEAGVNT